MSPQFIFRIDEITESRNVTASYSHHGHWIPSIRRGVNERVFGAGATGIWWYMNGASIQQLNATTVPPAGSSPFQIFSVYYTSGFGFWVLRGDATVPPASESWHPLSFEWDEDDCSAYLTNAGEQPTLRVQRNDQRWPGMLLPDTNQVPPAHRRPPYTGQGGLKGDLAIFLALLALSMEERLLMLMLPHMLVRGSWGTHEHPHGRHHKRGVVVYVYTVPTTWDNTRMSSAKDLELYQEGHYGKYYPY